MHVAQYLVASLQPITSCFKSKKLYTYIMNEEEVEPDLLETQLRLKRSAIVDQQTLDFKGQNYYFGSNGARAPFSIEQWYWFHISTDTCSIYNYI